MFSLAIAVVPLTEIARHAATSGDCRRSLAAWPAYERTSRIKAALRPAPHGPHGPHD